MKTLFVNSIMRSKELSRTWRITQSFIDALPQNPGDELIELDLRTADLHPISIEQADQRPALAAAGDLQHPLLKHAAQFAQADRIIIAAPYWDLSFPALLKLYVENIFVGGLTFRYSEEGRPVSLCRAKKMVYITTSGGRIGENNFGADYFAGICRMFNITDFQCISAEFMDAQGMPNEQLLDTAIKQAATLAKNW